MKARKNAVELAGARQAHLRDGTAMVRFLHWFSIKRRAGKPHRDRSGCKRSKPSGATPAS